MAARLTTLYLISRDTSSVYERVSFEFGARSDHANCSLASQPLHANWRNWLFEIATFGGAYEFGEDVRSEDEYSVSSVDEEELASLVRMDLDVDEGEIFKKYRILAIEGSARAC